MDYLFGRDTGIWADSTEKWDEVHPCWKIVGNNPRRVLKNNDGLYNNDDANSHIFLLDSFFNINGFLNDTDGKNGFLNDTDGKNGFLNDADGKPSIDKIFYKVHHLVSFSSGRTMTAVSNTNIEIGTYVIVEADRGEDCGMITGTGEDTSEGDVKIIRLANHKDIEVLEQRKIQEKKALERCIILVREKELPMEITGCEFQWDMKKITFYFKSDKRIDFRELVRELFKHFKIRIWMSMENRK